MAQARNEFQVRSPQAARARSSSNTSQHDIRLAFIRPGKPVENEYIESFNGRFRDVKSVRGIGVEPLDNVRR